MGTKSQCLQPYVPILDGVLEEGHVGDVNEPSDVVMVSDAAFEAPKILIHAPRHKWRDRCMTK